MADISGDAFLDFFASPSLSHAGSRFNSTFPATGSFATSQPPPDADNDDDDWGDFMGPPSGSYPASDFDLAPSNGFSSNPPPRSTSTVFDPFHFADSGSAGFVEPESNRIGSDSKGIVFEKPKGPLPLSLFGFDEEEEASRGEEGESGGSVVNLPVNGSDVSLHQKSSQDVMNGYSDFKLGASEILANLYAHTPPIEHQTGLISDTNELDSVSKPDTSPNGTNEVFDDEDDWEFHGAVSGDKVEERDFKGGPEVSESEGETTSVISKDQKAGQDPSKFPVTNLESMNSPLQFADLFTSQSGVSNKNSKVNGGTDVKATSFFPDAFMSFPVANHMENGYANVTYPSQNGVSNSEVNGGTDLKATSFFPDAFMSFPVANHMENGNANVTYPTPENTNDDLDDFGEFMDAASEPVSEYQDHSTKSESNRQPFPESIFSDGTVDSNEGHQNVTYEATFAPRNGTTIQGSEKSIHDIISNLYTQDQHGPSIDSGEKPVENGSSTVLKTLDSSSDSLNYGDKSRDFKEEVGGVKENSSDVVQKGSIKFQDLQISVDFFARLRDKLHFVALCLLEEAENSEAQEARKALQDDMGSEIYLEKNMPINGCLNDFIEVLDGPTFQKIDSEFLLPRELLSAEKDWKVAIKLLKESKLIVKILESGSPDDQSAYFSTWSSIVSVCAEELRHGALIWRQAVENNLQIQILSDPPGQRYIHSLGEIYRIIQLLGLSAKVYKPWMLFSKEDQSSLFLVLDECSALWSSSGLEEAFWNLLGSVDSVSGQSVEALVESFEHIQAIDVLVVQDCVFLQQKSICQLSLLPEQMLPELKSVSWNGMRCFLKVANCWANLISQEPPCLPQLRVG